MSVVNEWPMQIWKEQEALGISDEDLEQYLVTEHKYLASLKQEPPQDTLRFDYVNALNNLKQYE